MGAKGTLLGTGDLRQVHCVQQSVKHRAFLSVSLLNLLFSFLFSVHTAQVVKILPSLGIKPGLSTLKEKSLDHQGIPQTLSFKLLVSEVVSLL